MNLIPQGLELFLRAPKHFSVGDVVKLRSGGPPMVIAKILQKDDLEHAVLAWTNSDGGFETTSVPTSCLAR